MQPRRKLFAVVPAAGLSRRMGRPKLLLPLGGASVIRRLLAVLDRPEITETIVVMRPDDDALLAEVGQTTATTFRPPSAPPDMRQSVEWGVTEIERRHHPQPEDGWLLVPADHPMLEPAVLDRLFHRWQKDDCRILVPRCGARRGHPTLFRWDYARQVHNIPPNQGINWLLQTHAADVTELSVESEAVVTDLDTPADYETLRRTWSGE